MDYCRVRSKLRSAESKVVEEWLNANTLFASLIWGSVGMVYFIYGKKQRALIPAIGGIAMIAVSCVVPNWLWMSLTCIGLMVGVWWLVRRGD